MLRECCWIVLCTVHVTAFSIGGRVFRTWCVTVTQITYAYISLSNIYLGTVCKISPKNFLGLLCRSAYFTAPS